MAHPLRPHPPLRGGEATRTRILATASELFAESGFEATTIRAIAMGSGVTDGALYYHFASKRDILNALWDTGRNAPLPHPDQRGWSREDLARQAEKRFDVWVDNAALLRVLFQQSLEGDDRAFAFRRSVLARWRATIIPSLLTIYGQAASLVAEAQIHTLTGLAIDTVLRCGSTFREVARQDPFRERLRHLINQALPRSAPNQDQLTPTKVPPVSVSTPTVPGSDAPAPQPGGPPHPNTSETRARILDAAHVLFGQQGFSATKVKDIAHHAGVADAALYYYFRSKREILDAVWTTSWVEDFRVEPSRTPITGESLDAATDHLWEATANNQSLHSITVRQVLAGDRAALALRNQTVGALDEYIFRQFRACYDNERAHELADSLAMLFLGVYHNGLIEHGEHFADTLRTPEFRQQGKALVRLVIPIEDETRLRPEPCVP